MANSFILEPVVTGAPDSTLTADEFAQLVKTTLRTRTDEGSVQERTVDELIKAKMALAEEQATAVPWGLRIAKTYPPGTDPGSPVP